MGVPTPVWAFDPAQTYVQPQFLPPQLLPPPPVEGDSVWHKQLDHVLKSQRGLPGSEIAAIKDEQRLRIELLTSVVGPNFTRENLPKTCELLDHVLASIERVSSADKKFWHTRRPYLTDMHVRLYVDPIDASPSYPSGHAAGSRVLAEVIGMLVPEKLAALRARADEIGQHRVEAGVHFPNDIQAGRMLAMLVVGAMLANDDFEDDLMLARKELEKVR
jgi:acid phosphatase (class A)